MKKFFITFWQTHIHRIWDKVFDKDCVWCVEADNYGEAREKIFNIFWSEFCFIYDKMSQEDLDKFYYRWIIDLS